MAHNEKLAEKIRQHLKGTKNLNEKKMFGGIAFMINDKMCVGVDKDDMILRCAPEMTDELLKKTGARHFDLSGKPSMKGWLLIGTDGTNNKKSFEFWMETGIEANKKATVIKKITKKK